MKAAVFTDHGSSEVLKVIEMDKPQLTPDHVLINVKAFALNRLDVWTRKGLPNLDIEFPHIGGSDFAGIIEEVGSNVTHLHPGDRVAVNPTISCGHCLQCRSGEISLCSEFALLGEHKNGGAAEYVTVHANNVLEIPDHVEFINTAAIGLTAMTTYRMLTSRANLQPGETVLVTGAGGGIGTMATQLAHYLGGKVIALTSSQKKMEKSKELGAIHTINYREAENWSKTVWQLTDKSGIDVVIDSAGEAVFNQAIRTLAKGGRYVTCGATTGRSGEINIAALFWKQLSILGSSMASHREFEEVMHLFFTGKLSPVIDSTYMIDEIKQAHQRQEDPEHMGKIVIEMD